MIKKGLFCSFVQRSQYVICYQKGLLNGFFGYEKDFKNYSNPDADPRGAWVLGYLTVGMTSAMRPNQDHDLIDPSTGNVFPVNQNRVWAFIPESMEKMIKEGRVIFPKDPVKKPMQKRFQSELKSNFNPLSTLLIEKVGLNTEATRTIQEILGGNIFDYSKPISLLKTLIPQVCNGSDIVLDFFSGSATTAHAVMQLNAEEASKNSAQAGKRKFILVQLPETCDEKSEAFKSGYATIAEIGKERIRRAGQKILSEHALNAADVDIGFRVLKIDSSNMKDVYYTPDQLHQADLEQFTDNIKADRSAEDLLFQVLLDWGIDLNLPISQETLAGKTVWFVDGNTLAACFDNAINTDFVEALSQRQPQRVVFRDDSFASDSVKINVEQLFKRLSPQTEIKTI